MKRQSGHGMPKPEKPAVPGEWLYLAPGGTGAAQIAESIRSEYDVELWEEAGVLEIVFSEKKSMDMEHVKLRAGDEFTRNFAEKNGCGEVYLVTFDAAEFAQVKPVMQKILAQCGGLFCGDTEDLEPTVRGEES